MQTCRARHTADLELHRRGASIRPALSKNKAGRLTNLSIPSNYGQILIDLRHCLRGEPNLNVPSRRPTSRRDAGRRTQEERSSSTKARIMAATRDCLFEYGYAGATMSAIAEKAGVTQGALQHHYGSRPEVFAAFVDHFFESLPKLTKPQQGASSTLYVESFLRETFQAYGTQIAVALLQLRIGAHIDPELSKSIESKIVALDREKVWVGLFRRAGLASSESKVMREVVSAMLRGFAARQAYSKKRFSTDAELSLLIEMVSSYLARRTSSAK